MHELEGAVLGQPVVRPAGLGARELEDVVEAERLAAGTRAPSPSAPTSRSRAACARSTGSRRARAAGRPRSSAAGPTARRRATTRRAGRGPGRSRCSRDARGLRAPLDEHGLAADLGREALKRSISGFSSGSFSGEYGNVTRTRARGRLGGRVAAARPELALPPPPSSLAAAARERDRGDREGGEHEDGELAALHGGDIIAAAPDGGKGSAAARRGGRRIRGALARPQAPLLPLLQRRVGARQVGGDEPGREHVVLAQRVLERGRDARVAVPALQDPVRRRGSRAARRPRRPCARWRCAARRRRSRSSRSACRRSPCASAARRRRRARPRRRCRRAGSRRAAPHISFGGQRVDELVDRGGHRQPADHHRELAEHELLVARRLVAAPASARWPPRRTGRPRARRRGAARRGALRREEVRVVGLVPRRPVAQRGALLVGRRRGCRATSAVGGQRVGARHPVGRADPGALAARRPGAPPTPASR